MVIDGVELGYGCNRIVLIFPLSRYCLPNFWVPNFSWIHKRVIGDHDK